jgi:hypothetical protein
MARHNQEGRGVDQQGNLWKIGYQPDWLRQVKISRDLPDGRRRSSLTLFRNPTRQALASPGKSIRTRILSVDGSVDVQISLEDRDALVDHVVVGVKQRRGRKTETIRFVIQGGLPRPRR